MYKAIAMDLDGTLLTSDKSVLLQDKEAIEEARAAGKVIILCSGRSVRHMQETIERLDFHKDREYYIAFNGTMTIDAKSGSVLMEKTIDPEIVRWFIQTGREHCEKINTQLYQTEMFYVEREHEGTRLYEETGIGRAVRVPDLMDLVDKRILNAVLISHEPDWQEEFLRKAVIPASVLLVPSSPYLLEFSDPSVDKGSSLTNLVRSLGIRPEEVIAVGDDINDLSMLRAAGLSVAMKNGVDKVRQLADVVTTRTNDEGGIAEIIHQYLL